MYTDSFGNPVDPTGQGSYFVTNSFGNPTDGLYRGGYGSNWGQAYSNAYTPSNFVQSGYVAAGRPSFMQSVANAAWGRGAMWGSPTENIQPSIHSMATKPFDAAAWVSQNVVNPYLGYSVIGGSLGGAFGGGFGRGLAGGLGMSSGVGVMSGIGRLAGGVTGGILATGALNSGINAGIYGRQNAESLSSNFSNVYFGQGGNPVTGRGLSGTTAAMMGNQLSEAGQRDWMFSREQYAGISQMSTSAGLQDFSSQGRITESIKSVAELVKLTVTIMKDPDTKKAIEALAQLQMGGADVSTFGSGASSTAGRALQKLNMYAAMGGTSVQNLMQTVGAQGQAIYQSAGLTPYLGQLAAANAYAGFAGAQRIGAVTPQQMARLGGIQGATAGVMGANIHMTQSPVGQMAGYLSLLGGTDPTKMSMNEMVGRFSGMAASNPIQVMGSQMLYRGEMSEKLLNQKSSVTEALLIQASRSVLSKSSPTAEEAMYLLTTYFGMSEHDARSWLTKRSTEQAPGAREQAISGIVGSHRDTMRAMADQQNMGSAIEATVGRTWGGAKRGLRGVNDQFFLDINRQVGKVEDYLTKKVDEWGYSNVMDMAVVNPETMLNTDLQEINYVNMPLIRTDLSSDRSNVVMAINDLAKKGDADAREYLNAKDAGGRSRALNKLTVSGKLGDYSNKLDFKKGGLAEVSEFRRDLEQGVAKAERSRVLEDSEYTKTMRAIDTRLESVIDLKKGDLSDLQRGRELYRMGAAAEYRDLVAELGQDEAFEVAKKDPKFASLLASARQDMAESGETGDDQLKYRLEQHAGRIYAGARQTGLAGTARKYVKNLKVEELENSPEARERALRKAAEGGVLAGMGYKRGGGAFGIGGLSETELDELESRNSTAAGQMESLTATYRQSKISFDTFNKVMKGAGRNDTDMFGVHVETFGQAVHEFKTGKKVDSGLSDKQTDAVAKFMNDKEAPKSNEKTQMPATINTLVNVRKSIFG